MNSEEKETKPNIITKSSMEILSELFSTFHAEPPMIVKQENTNESKKHKKKKKHKNKDKKHKKKSKKRKRSDSSGSSSVSELDFDLAKLLVKQEKQADENKIKIEGTEISLSLDEIIDSIPEEEEEEQDEKPLKKLKVDTQECKGEEGEISSDDDKEEHPKSKKHKGKHKHKRNRSKDKSGKYKTKLLESSKCETRARHHHRSRSRDRHKSKDKEEVNNFYIIREKEDLKTDCKRSRSPQKYSDARYKDKDEHRDYRDNERYSRYHSFYDKNDDFYKPRERERSYDKGAKDDFYKIRSRSFERNRDGRWYGGKRSWENSNDRKYRDRGWSPEKESSYIDKKKLLEIARKNAIQMMKSGSLPGALTLGPQAQEKVIAAIKAGGKTIEELTDFCKTLSKKEDLGELSDVEEERGSESDNDKPFNHPFQIKDRPTTITMNIKNSVPLPIKSTQERTTELRMQFPVSSGQHHRKNENEWVPVEPKKDSAAFGRASITLTKEVVPITPLIPPTLSAPLLSTISVQPSVSEAESQQSSIDISAIVSQRLTAMRKLQENPHDVQALSQMYKSTKEVQSWAESKQQPGQFTGSVGGNFLSQSELSSGYQAWAKKDQLQHAAPVSGGMGMHLLQKMGWKPGEGLGKEKTGALEPLLLEVKLDKRGLVANEETQKRKKMKPQQTNPKGVQGKHPVSLLGEYACKNKLGAPTYELCFECGPDHKKNFLFKVILNGMEFKPNVASPNKKEAKANAATLCLQKLGILT